MDLTNQMWNGKSLFQQWIWRWYKYWKFKWNTFCFLTYHFVMGRLFQTEHCVKSQMHFKPKNYSEYIAFCLHTTENNDWIYHFHFRCNAPFHSGFYYRSTKCTQQIRHFALQQNIVKNFEILSTTITIKAIITW